MKNDVALPARRVSCIICAYNEADRISTTLEAIVGNPLFGEIIVVNDGSTDATAAQVASFPDVIQISFAANRGKSHAMAEGLRAARFDQVMLLDADLSGLKARHIEALARPVLTGSADISISLRGNTLGVYKMLGLDFVSGERMLPRRLLLDAVETLTRLPRWAPEVFMNELIIQHDLRIAVVDWRDVVHTPKSAKVGAWQGAKAEFRMVSDTLRMLTPFGVLRQNVELLRLRRAERTH